MMIEPAASAVFAGREDSSHRAGSRQGVCSAERIAIFSQFFFPKKGLPLFCFLLAACVGLLTPLQTKAASLELVPEWGASGVPTNVSMYVYVPDSVVENPPILVLLHYWGGTASSVFPQAEWGGIVAAADQYGFMMVVPERSSDCWDYGSTKSLTHDGGGETHAIAQMVQYAISTYHANADRVYVTGDSCGGMMTQAMLGVYPDMFKAGAALAGVPIGGAWAPIEHTAQEWGDLARACYPEYSGPRPRVQLWHGTADELVNYTNHLESIMQWSNVLGLDPDPTSTTTETIEGITNQWTHRVWKDENDAVLLDAWADIEGDHGPSDALFLAEYVIPFLKLDYVGPYDPISPRSVTFYQDYNYGGAASQSVSAGRYTTDQLAALGMPDDWASSVRIAGGYTVTMYADDNFGGTSWTLTSDTSEFGSISANDQVSSVVIENDDDTVANGTYKLVARHSGKALDAYGAQTTNGTQIIQWSYGGGANQKWTVTDTGDGNCKIIGVQSGKALDIYAGDTANGTKVELWDFWGGPMQLYKFTATDGGYYRITPNCATDSCLDVSGVSTADGAVVHLWQWLGGSNQQWAPQTP